MKDENARQRRRALEQLRALDWPSLANAINGYGGETPRSKRYSYGATWCFGHFKNQGGTIAIGHLDAAARRDAILEIKATHSDHRNRLPEPDVTALRLDLLRDNVSLHEARAQAKRYGAQLEICQGNNMRSDAVGRLYLRLADRGVGFIDWAASILRIGE